MAGRSGQPISIDGVVSLDVDLAGSVFPESRELKSHGAGAAKLSAGTSIGSLLNRRAKTMDKLLKSLGAENLAIPAGFEPATRGVEIRYSIQLSYGIVWRLIARPSYHGQYEKSASPPSRFTGPFTAASITAKSIRTILADPSTKVDRAGRSCTFAPHLRCAAPIRRNGNLSWPSRMRPFHRLVPGPRVRHPFRAFLVDTRPWSAHGVSS